MSKLTKYKFSDLYEMSSGISSSKQQAGHGSPFISFSTVFNNYFLPEELPDFDLFTGGFPCQPFSSAGLQLGEEDKYGRGTLFYHIIRICAIKKPEYILLENVKGLTQKKFSSTFKTIQDSLKEIGYGDIAYAVLNSKDYGIPQNRERLWMFAKFGGLPSNFNIVPPKTPLTRKFGDLLDSNPPEYLYLSEKQIAHLKE